jgi:hypothetical protein
MWENTSKKCELRVHVGPPEGNTRLENLLAVFYFLTVTLTAFLKSVNRNPGQFLRLCKLAN